MIEKIIKNNFKKFQELSFGTHLLISSILIVLLIILKTKPFLFNLSSLIGIWEGFYFLNPDYFPDNFIIYKDGGYDGQFFYMNSVYLSGNLNTPILDSFLLRFNRIGLSILGAIIIKLFGIKSYPLILFLLLHSFHLLSAYLLRNMIAHVNHRKYYLLYFYSPFSWNSNLLLVCDSLFVSVFIILIFLCNKTSLGFLNNNKKPFNEYLYILTFIITLILLSIKEIGLPIIATLALFSLLKNKIIHFTIYSSCLVIYFILKFSIQYNLNYFVGMNPLGFFQLIDYPILGLIKSIHFNSALKEIPKFIILLFYISLVLQLKNIKTFFQFIYFLPLLFIFIVIGISEEGYWQSFDNLSRFFTICLPYSILLSNLNRNFKFYKIDALSYLLFLLLLIRNLRIKEVMSFFISQ